MKLLNLKEEIKEVLEELENMYEISELEEQVNNINKIRDYIINLQQENQSLKEQLEENKDKINWYENFEINKTIDKLRLKHNIQQKEFIEYMNKTIEELECDDVDDEEMKGYLIQRIDTFKEILSKFKKIIGSDINVGSIGGK